MDWVDFVIRVGLPTAALAGIGWFVAARVWPFIVKAWETQQNERKEEREKFLAALAAERESFQQVVTTERLARIDERDRFLGALEKHRQELAGITRTQQQLRRALEKTNGAKGEK